jgi:hypothetical protein
METTYDIAQVTVEDCEIFYHETLAFGLDKAEMLQRVEALKAERINFQVFEAPEEALHKLVITHIDLVTP